MISDLALSLTTKAPSPFHQPDETHLLLTASFGHIIPNNFLEKFLPANRLNVHPSLLPKYRGAAPIQWTIMNGDETTGISVQRLVERGKGIDGGEIVGSVANLVSASCRLDLFLMTACWSASDLYKHDTRSSTLGWEPPCAVSEGYYGREGRSNTSM